jgi:glucose 1-dehydrogenase
VLLTDKVMVVTGGNSGIGAAIARAAAAEGAKVVIDYVAHEDATERLVDEIKGAGGEATGVEADITKPAELHRLMQAAIDTYGRLDVLVNNAGIETRQSLLDTTEEDFDKVMAVDLRSAFFAAQAAASTPPSTRRRRATRSCWASSRRRSRCTASPSRATSRTWSCSSRAARPRT